MADEVYDWYNRVAAALFKVPVDDVTPEMRKRAKSATFFAIYGGNKLPEVPPAQSWFRRAVDRIRSANPLKRP